ncbi:hypothetical protein CYMTET_14556 [Cymbomonas tetramitiformis]|uniref:Polygalacturonase n=1 Tax=Cymbomonas tetramitiformis TaxID=36881 RepID=A0AAE0GFR4_9CHLO|nr:hypothetical protein CYMTET_14556 [Cymbomonas tetramitiformis]
MLRCFFLVLSVLTVHASDSFTQRSQSIIDVLPTANLSGGATSLGDEVLCLKDPKLLVNGTLDISPCLYQTGRFALLVELDGALRKRAVHNTLLLNYALLHVRHFILQVPANRRYTILLRTSDPHNRFLMQGGVYGQDLENVTLQLDGIMDFGACMPMDSANCRFRKEDYPGFSYDKKLANTVSMLQFTGMLNFKFTSSTRGRVVGGGEQWYGVMNILELGDERGTTKPIMFDMEGKRSYGLEISHISFEQAAYWTTYIWASDVHIHHSNVTARTLPPELPKPLEDPSEWLEQVVRTNAWNTDGFDVSGDNVHIHDCHIMVSDDCVANKGGKNWMVENLVASGAGLTVGSEGKADNVTFRNIVMDRTIRGIYIKTTASNVLYENILIKEGLMFPIWIGPPWQGLSGGCPLIFPFLPTGVSADLGALTHHSMNALCYADQTMRVTNITLRNVTVVKSFTTPIVLFGGHENYGVSMENVTVGETPSDERFPFTAKPECYNVTIQQESLTKPGQLFENCAPTAPVCTQVGIARQAFIPCCNQSNWNPKGPTPKEWWGVC